MPTWTKTDLGVIYHDCKKKQEARAAKRRRPAKIRLWDGDFNLRGRVVGSYNNDFDHVLNDTGSGTIDLPDTHYLAKWVVRYWERGTANVHVTVDKDGTRWGGRLESVSSELTSEGDVTVRLTFLSDYEELKHVILFPNPFTPPEVQFPKVWLLAGPACWVLKMSLFANLFREFANLWSLPDDPLDFDSWTQSLDYKRWPILVKPGSLLLDDSAWTVIHADMDTWHDASKTILGGGQLAVVCRRWLVGDEQPWPGANLNRNGQLIVDVVDKSGWFEQTAVGGTIAGGLVRTVLQVADNLVDEGRVYTEAAVRPSEYNLPGFLGTAPQAPWVVYRAGPRNRTMHSATWVHSPATVGRVTVGGHSMPGVNEAMEVAIQLTFSALSTYLFLPDLGAPAATLFMPLLEDTLMAYMSVESGARQSSLGWSHYRENFEDGASQAWTLSALLAIRDGFFKTRQIDSFSFTVGDGEPYLIGENGEGHFGPGDRVGAEIPGSGGQVTVQQVVSLRLSETPDGTSEWEITMGARTAGADPVNDLIDWVKDQASALHELGMI